MKKDINRELAPDEIDPGSPRDMPLHAGIGEYFNTEDGREGRGFFLALGPMDRAPLLYHTFFDAGEVRDLAMLMLEKADWMEALTGQVKRPA